MERAKNLLNRPSLSVSDIFFIYGVGSIEYSGEKEHREAVYTRAKEFLYSLVIDDITPEMLVDDYMERV